MWLVNFPKIRIKEYPKGFVVEIEKTKWYGKKYWTHAISVTGIKNAPNYFSTFDNALQQACKYFDFDLRKGSNPDVNLITNF